MFSVGISLYFTFGYLKSEWANDFGKSFVNKSTFEQQKTDTTQTINSLIEKDTLIDSDEYLIIGKPDAIIKIVSEYEVDSFPGFEIISGYKNDYIIGKNTSYNELELFRKHSPPSTFEDYQVEVYTGKLAEPDFNTNHDANRFVTRITKECENGINFAGHYTLVTWGCGSPCQSGVVVDRKTGDIYDGYGTSLGAKFKKNSRMIISNIGALDTTENLIDVCAYCEIYYDEWSGNEFKKIK